ncbi:hypothetical protein D3C71_578580 [compost metagenome]
MTRGNCGRALYERTIVPSQGRPPILHDCDPAPRSRHPAARRFYPDPPRSGRAWPQRAGCHDRNRDVALECPGAGATGGAGAGAGLLPATEPHGRSRRAVQRCRSERAVSPPAHAHLRRPPCGGLLFCHPERLSPCHRAAAHSRAGALRGGYPAAGALPDGALHHRWRALRWPGGEEGGQAGLLGGERGALRAPGGDADPLLGVAGRGVCHGRGAFLGRSLQRAGCAGHHDRQPGGGCRQLGHPGRVGGG